MDCQETDFSVILPEASPQPRAGHRSGFVGIVGRPNVGKSTILNYYVKRKVAIVSPRPQTTRHRILGILTRDDAQVLFLDTPGFHQAEHALGRHMLEAVTSAVDEADVLLIVLDARLGVTEDDRRVFAWVRRTSALRGQRRPALLAINKVDVVKKPTLLPLLETCAATRLFTDCVPVSAVTGEQMDVLLTQLITLLPERPRWYDPQQFTDQTTRQLTGEFIREQVLLATRQEVPHAVAVLVDEVVERGGLVSIHATIYVEREGQKAILIGRNGMMLKQIGQAARRELEHLVGRKVYLEVWVKVAEGWRGDERLLRQLGYAGDQAR
jgi:GTP-binding protein Era